MQHIDYKAQLSNKGKNLSCETNFPEDKIQVFSGKEYGYRNRVDFLFHAGGIGLRKKGEAGKIVDIERCEIASEGVNKILGEVRSFFAGTPIDAFDAGKKKGTFIQAIIRATSIDSSIVFTLNNDSARIGQAMDKIKEFAAQTSAGNVAIARKESKDEDYGAEECFAVKGHTLMEEEILGKKFFFPVNGFFQNNREVTIMMHEHVNKIIAGQDTRGASLLDLYGGVGAFGIINSSLFRETKIAEGFEPAVRCAERNILENRATNAKAICLDAKHLKRINFREVNLFTITDPPRSGMDEKTIQCLKEIKPKTIIYVSCNPHQLGKDIKKFGKFELKSITLFDMFPQTPHYEAIAELALKDETD